jgi:hypothetical protein
VTYHSFPGSAADRRAGLSYINVGDGPVLAAAVPRSRGSHPSGYLREHSADRGDYEHE